MAYSMNGKVYTDHSLMDEIIYHTKKILNNIVLKNDSDADENETELSLEQSDYFMAIKNGSMDISFFPLTTDLLIQYGYDSLQAKIFVKDRSRIPKEDREDLLAYCNNWFLNQYEEINNYYRMLNGLPEYDTNEYDIYVDPNNEKLLLDDANTDFNFSIPIHEYTDDEINVLDSLGILDEIKNTYTGKHYRYLRYLGAKRIDIYTARKAANWDILYMPSVEYLVKTRFKEIYTINRDIYLRRTYQDAYKFQSNYYDEIIMILILCQTFSDMIVDIPEWYIRRDVFDLRTVQYFLESQGVKFFKVIPLKYQIRIVKGMNKLIRYKSTTKNINDILNIFGVSGTTVYKYYLFKKFVKTTHNRTIIDNTPVIWEMDDEYDFGDEELTEEILDRTDAEIYDFLDESVSDFDPTLELHEYNFGNEDASTVYTDEESDKKDNYNEENKIIIDEYGNIYDLEFVKVPVNESYDDYIKDSIYRMKYDDLTLSDPYWDGEDVHYYVRNQIVQKDFTIEGTKYMSLDYKISFSEYIYQMNYFLGMIFTIDINMDDIRIAIPEINSTTEFKLTDIFILLYCLSSLYDNRLINIRTPKIKTGKKHDYYNYLIFNGGMPWNGDDPYVPPEPEPEPGFEVPYLDFGEEGIDNFIRDKLYIELYDFGYQNTIDLSLPLNNYDYGEVNGESYEGIYQITPTPNGWLMGNLYDYTSEDGNYVPPKKNKNFVGDAEDYNFGDEYIENIDIANANLRYYDFLSEEIKYIAYEEPKLPDEDVEHYWDNLEKGSFTEILDGGPVNINRKFRRDINGGDKEYSKVTHETHYEWMRWDNPDLFVPTTGRIFGFNLSADLEEIEKNISVRHSDFGFEKGYTLKDFGCDTFVTATKISSIDELMYIYKENTKCYKALEEKLTDINTRDEYVILQYVFNSLFTKPFDFDLYRLKNGEIADTYDQILKERNYTLYKYYSELLKEKDLEVRKDNIRGVLNDITGTLEYYLKSDYLQYIFQFVPTYSFEAINQYIHLMIDFFKSWKVYFLDPTVTYVLDDKKDNKVGVGDMMTEVKIKTWYTDLSNVSDFCIVKPIHYLTDENASMSKEIIDMYSYHVSDVTDETEFDGGYANSSLLRSNNYSLLDGGGVEDSSCIPFVMINAGNVSARKEIYDLDGGGVLEMQEYLNVDGLHCQDYYSTFPVANDFSVESFSVDGGTVTSTIIYNPAIITTVESRQIESNIRISSYRFNDLTVTDDGLFLGSNFADISIYETIKNQLEQDRKKNFDEIQSYIDTIKIYNDPALMEETVDNTFANYFAASKAVLKDFRSNETSNYCKKYVDTAVANLTEWFLELNPFGWEYF